jgi:tetratricopeptide (TPR) repeat protein
LKARRFFASPGRDTAREAITLLEQAVALDPAYAAAWGDLSWAYATYGIWTEPVPAVPRATEAATRALALDPGNALALITRGRTAALIEFDQEAAADYFRRAREAGADQSFWAYNASWAHLMPLGRYAEALEILRQARDRDPYAPPALQGEIASLRALGRLPEAVALARTVRVEASPPPSFAQVAALALILSGSLAEAEPLLAYVTARSGQFGALSISAQGMLNWARHDDIANRQLLDAMMAQRQAGNYVSPYMIGVVHLLLAEYDEALDWFERAVDAHDPGVVYLMPNNSRRHPAIGTHPRFLALLKRMHLPSQAELDAASGAAEQPGAAP